MLHSGDVCIEHGVRVANVTEIYLVLRTRSFLSLKWVEPHYWLALVTKSRESG